MPLLLNASRSTLAHASLAHLTPEFLALGDIIQSPRRHLPTELLLIIRSHLVSQLTAQLIADSARALGAQEDSLTSLLCLDCVSYNTDIYGPSVWDWSWDQFSGPCLCRGDIDDCVRRSKTFAEKIAQLHCDADRNLYTRNIAPLFRRSEGGQKAGSLQFSPKLLDATFFLELHLSRQARRLARLAFKHEISAASYRGHARPQPRHLPSGLHERSSSPRIYLKIRNIQDVVTYVLRGQYGCEAFQPPNSHIRATPSSVPSKPTTLRGLINGWNASGAQIVEFNAQEFGSLSKIADIPTTGPFTRLFTSAQRLRDHVYISFSQHEANHAWGGPFDNETERTGVDACRSTVSSEFTEKCCPPSCTTQPSSPSPRRTGGIWDDPWVNRAKLGRVQKELGLGIEYSTPYDISLHYQSSCICCSRGSTNSTSATSFSESPSSSSATKPNYSSTLCLIEDEAEMAFDDEEELGVVAGGITGVKAAGNWSTGSSDSRRKRDQVVIGPVAPQRDGGRRRINSAEATTVSWLLGWPVPSLGSNNDNNGSSQLIMPKSLRAQSRSVKRRPSPDACTIHSSWSSSSMTTIASSDAQESLVDHYVSHPLLLIITTCLCVPLMFMNIALTIICFYSRPRSLRIL